MSDNFAYRQKVNVGDTIKVQGPAGPVELKVLGTVKDYSWSRGTLFMDRGVFGKLFLDTKVDIVHVFLNRESEKGTQDARKSPRHLRGGQRLTSWRIAWLFARWWAT